MLSASEQKCGDIVETSSDAANFCIVVGGQAADTEHRSQGRPVYYDITANYFLTVVKPAASWHYHSLPPSLPHSLTQLFQKTIVN
jgi:hypothetical protein